MPAELDELEIPADVHRDGNPQEFVRFWICDGNDHVALRVGALEPSTDEPRIWGSIIADIAKHAAIALLQDNPQRRDLRSIVAEIELGFRDRLAQNANLSGQIDGSVH